MLFIRFINWCVTICYIQPTHCVDTIDINLKKNDLHIFNVKSVALKNEVFVIVEIKSKKLLD